MNVTFIPGLSSVWNVWGELSHVSNVFERIATSDCKKGKLPCFHRKVSHSTTLSKKFTQLIGSSKGNLDLKFFSFSNKTPKSCQITKVEKGVRTLESKSIPINAYG